MSTLGKYRGIAIPLCAVLAFALCIFPIWLVGLPPLADYPNHLARMYLLAQPQLPAHLAKYYQPFLHWQPNLAMDLVVPPLSRILPLAIAGKAFLSLTIASMAIGTWLLHYALHRRWSPWPLLAFLFVYNRFFLWGFVNYLFSLGLAVAGAGLWLLLQDRPRWLRIAVSAAVALAVYLGHLYAFGVYGLLITGIWAQSRLPGMWRARRIEVAEVLTYGLQFIAPVVLFLFVSPTASSYTDSYWGTLYRKVEAPFVVTYNYHLTFDALTLLALVGLLVFALIRGYVRFATPMRWALALLLLAYLVMPDKLFTSYGADRRIVVPIVLTVVAATELQLASVVWRRILLCGVAALLLVRMSLIASQWQISDRTYRSYIEAIDKLPVGARFTSVIPYDFERSLPKLPLSEIAALAVIRRQAIVPILFAYPKDAAQSIRFTPAMEALVAEMPDHILPKWLLKDLDNRRIAARKDPFLPERLQHFDYLLVTDEKAIPESIPPIMQPVFSGENFRLFRIQHQ